MSLLARSCAALAVTALTAGVVTVAPAGVAAASSGGGIYGGTTEPQPTSETVRKVGPGFCMTCKFDLAARTTRGAAARAPKPPQTGTFVPFD